MKLVTEIVMGDKRQVTGVVVGGCSTFESHFYNKKQDSFLITA